MAIDIPEDFKMRVASDDDPVIRYAYVPRSKRRGRFFGAKDVDAELITWAMQVNPNAPDELLALRARITYTIEGVYTVDEEDMPEYSDYDGELPALCVLIQSVCATLHDHAGVLASDLATIAFWREGVRSDDQTARPIALPRGAGEIVPMADLRGVLLPPGDGYAAYLFGRFDDFLSAVLTGESAVADCPQCRCLFRASEKRREKQVYCSPRCRHRAAVKRSTKTDSEKCQFAVY